MLSFCFESSVSRLSDGADTLKALSKQLSTLAAEQLALHSRFTCVTGLKASKKVYFLQTHEHTVNTPLCAVGDILPCFGVGLKHPKISAFRVHGDADSSVDIREFLQADSLVQCPSI